MAGLHIVAPFPHTPTCVPTTPNLALWRRWHVLSVKQLQAQRPRGARCASAAWRAQVLSEAVNWMAQALRDFGVVGMDIKALLDWMKEDLGSGNAGVRNSAVQLLGALHRCAHCAS